MQAVALAADRIRLGDIDDRRIQRARTVGRNMDGHCPDPGEHRTGGQRGSFRLALLAAAQPDQQQTAGRPAATAGLAGVIDPKTQEMTPASLTIISPAPSAPA